MQRPRSQSLPNSVAFQNQTTQGHPASHSHSHLSQEVSFRNYVSHLARIPGSGVPPDGHLSTAQRRKLRADYKELCAKIMQAARVLSPRGVPNAANQGTAASVPLQQNHNHNHSSPSQGFHGVNPLLFPRLELSPRTPPRPMSAGPFATPPKNQTDSLFSPTSRSPLAPLSLANAQQAANNRRNLQLPPLTASHSHNVSANGKGGVGVGGSGGGTPFNSPLVGIDEENVSPVAKNSQASQQPSLFVTPQKHTPVPFAHSQTHSHTPTLTPHNGSGGGSVRPLRRSHSMDEVCSPAVQARLFNAEENVVAYEQQSRELRSQHAQLQCAFEEQSKALAAKGVELRACQKQLADVQKENAEEDGTAEYASAAAAAEAQRWKRHAEEFRDEARRLVDDLVLKEDALEACRQELRSSNRQVVALTGEVQTLQSQQALNLSAEEKDYQAKYHGAVKRLQKLEGPLAAAVASRVSIETQRDKHATIMSLFAEQQTLLDERCKAVKLRQKEVKGLCQSAVEAMCRDMVLGMAERAALVAEKKQLMQGQSQQREKAVLFNGQQAIINRQQRDVQALRERVRHLQRERQNLQRQLRNAEESGRQMALIAGADDELVQKEMQANARRTAQAEERSAVLEEQLEILQGQLADSERSIASLRGECDEWRRQLMKEREASAAEVAKLKEERMAGQQALYKHVLEQRAVEEQLKEVRWKWEAARHQNAIAEAEHRKLEERCAQLRSEAQTKDLASQKAERDCDLLKQRYDDECRKNGDLIRRIEMLHARAEELQRRPDERVRELEALIEKLQARYQARSNPGCNPVTELRGRVEAERRAEESQIEAQRFQGHCQMLEKECKTLHMDVERGRAQRQELRRYLREYHQEAERKLGQLNRNFAFMRKLALTTFKVLCEEEGFVMSNALLGAQLQYLRQELDRAPTNHPVQPSSTQHPQQ